MSKVKNLLRESRKRVAEMQERGERVAKRAKLSTGNVECQLTSNQRQDQIEQVVEHYKQQTDLLQRQVDQLERLERERRKLLCIIKRQKLSILLTN